ncbi:MAG: phytoene desaturase family protein [Chryseosolibacter sp.]
MKKIAVIGSGFAGLASATCLAKEGFDVTVFEKNDSPGGRARQFKANGFAFDMGPSWYWMPGVIEKYFNHFGKTTGDFYDLKRLDPSYRIFFGKNDFLDIPSGVEQLRALFEILEPGSGPRLIQFLKEAEFKYTVGVERLVYKPGLSATELLDAEVIKGLFKLQIFQSLSRHVRKFFRNPRIIQLLEFPVLFLGATPQKTPALYSLMNYADMALGTWYPMGGMYKIIEAMVTIAEGHGVTFRFSHPVTAIELKGARAEGIRANERFFPADFVVAGADYHHVEKDLVPEAYRQYNEAYWNSRVMAPSCLIFYLGLNKKVSNLRHHTLFFDEDFARHTHDIYVNPQWPAAPQFYVSCPSKTDPSVAPPGGENLFILIPVAPGLQDAEHLREKYFDMVMSRLENLTGENIRQHIVYQRSYAHNDFVQDYNAFKGNAYGLANTLLQTANFKPRMLNKKINNVFYTGQLTVPGPGVPPSIISGQVVAETLMKQYRKASAENVLRQPA